MNDCKHGVIWLGLVALLALMLLGFAITDRQLSDHEQRLQRMENPGQQN